MLFNFHKGPNPSRLVLKLSSFPDILSSSNQANEKKRKAPKNPVILQGLNLERSKSLVKIAYVAVILLPWKQKSDTEFVTLSVLVKKL